MMLERYAVIISEGAPDPMLPEVEGEWVKYADAHATIADLQGQLATAKAPRVYDCGSCAIGKGFEQRVAQLEGERDMYKRSSDTFAECVDNIREAMGLETTHYLVLPDDVQDLRDAHTTLQADHARVLGLLAQVTEIADMMLKGTECEHDVGLCSCEHRRIVKQAQRSLPAQPAQGARCDQCGTRLAHEDHKYDCPYMIVKRQHAEGETRA